MTLTFGNLNSLILAIPIYWELDGVDGYSGWGLSHF